MISVKDWKLCRHNHEHHGKTDNSTFDIMEMKELDDFLMYDHIKKWWIDLYPQDDTGDDSGLQSYDQVFTSV